MSKMSELDQVAQGVADHIKEIIYHGVEWQISDIPVNGMLMTELSQRRWNL